MPAIPNDATLAVIVVTAIQQGDVETLQRRLREHPELATSRIVDATGVSRTLLHVATDWPGHFPNVDVTVAVLVAAGADVNAPVGHPGSSGPPETALHWAASSGDVNAIDALLDVGADVEAPGAVFTGGTAMSDAVVFAQWRAARRLVERGAATTIWQAAALGLLARVQQRCAAVPPPSLDDITNALWHACRGGQREVAEYLLGQGADANRIGHDGKTALDAAYESGAADLVRELLARGVTGAAGAR